MKMDNRRHQTVYRAGGVVDHLWSIEEIVGLLE
jgi:hypothetical protein